MQAPTFADFSHHQQTSEAGFSSFQNFYLKSTIIGNKCLPKTTKGKSKQVANRPKRKRTRTRRLIESARQGTEHVLTPGADDNVACAPSDLDGDRPLPQIQAPVTDSLLAGGQSQSSQGHFGNTDMNSETGRFTNIDFHKGLFDT